MRTPVEATVAEDVPERIAGALRAIAGGTLLDISRAHDMIDLAPRPIYVVSHRNPASAVVHEHFGEFIAVYRNSYLLGAIDNLALLALAAHHLPERLPPPLLDVGKVASGIARQHLAEQLRHVGGETRLARVLYLEAVIEHDAPLRALFALKGEHVALEQASNALTRLAADFTTFHEFGHVAEADTRFEQARAEALGAVAEVVEAAAGIADDERTLREELRCDLFALDVLAARYAGAMCERSFRTYVGAMVQLLCRVVALDALAADLHRANYAPETPRGDIDSRLHAMAVRERAMLAYLDAFVFGERTVVAAEHDTLLALALPEALLARIADGATLVEPLSEHSRRVAELVSRGFEDARGFEAIIEASRTPWVLS